MQNCHTRVLLKTSFGSEQKLEDLTVQNGTMFLILKLASLLDAPDDPLTPVATSIQHLQEVYGCNSLAIQEIRKRLENTVR